MNIPYRFVEGNINLNVDEIIYIETNGHKNIFHLKDRSYSVYKKLGDIEDELRAEEFVRAHQSFLVNMRYIEKISSYILTLTTGMEISVPKPRYREVKRRYAMYKEEYKNC
ncbi:MAG: LytTR family transcriptional regulator [Lachnospiraceae bacterium]|nr:LytTR family transcriptional regulator [Lachnospiraceae bacterium]